MSNHSGTTSRQARNIEIAGALKASWLPMIVIALAQIQMGFNVNALAISMGSIVEDLGVSPATVGTALVIYSLAVAGLVMIGAKVGRIIGSRLAFQIGIGAHGASMAMMAISTNELMMGAAQLIAGVAAALAVPALVVMITAHYHGSQQEQSLGLLGAAQASSSALAFLVVGLLSTVVSWRWSFVLLVILGAINIVLSFRLMAVERRSGIRIDWVGAVFAAAAITLISLGFNNVGSWGLIVASSGAPFDIGGVSPAPIMIVGGIAIGQLFFSWLRRQESLRKPTLFAIETLETREERSATIALLIIAAIGPAVNFLLPLYIQIVQGRSVMETAIAIVPYAAAIFIGTTFVVRVYGILAPRQIGRYGFIMVAFGLFVLAHSVNNEWGTPSVIGALLIVGLGEGALLTLMFNVLVSASPKELSGDVGALRGTTNNLATGLGTAIASVLAIAVLGLVVSASIAESPILPPTVADQLYLDNVDFISNDDLAAALTANTDATTDQIAELVRINTDARLRALTITFQVLAVLTLLGIVPASGLPPYRRGEVPVDLNVGKYDEDDPDFDIGGHATTRASIHGQT